MLFKVILTRAIKQSTSMDVFADNIEDAKDVAERRFREGLEWDDDSVAYGIHEIHGDGVEQQFVFGA